MSDAAITATGLSKRFEVNRHRRSALKELVTRGRAPKGDEFWALRDATFEVRRGGIVEQAPLTADDQHRAAHAVFAPHRQPAFDQRTCGGVERGLPRRHLPFHARTRFGQRQRP